jgi:DNA polymerase III subunit delta
MAAKDGLSVADLTAALAAGEPAPVYLLHGEEDFLAEEALKAILDAAVHPDQRGFNLDIFRGGEEDGRHIAAVASAFPMMADRRAVVLRDVERCSTKDLEAIGSYLQSPSPTTVFVLVATSADLRKRPYAVARKTGVVIECRPLYGNHIPGWITARAAASGWEITPEAARVLQAYVGTSLRALDNELEKLYTFLGKKQTIGAGEISEVVGLSREFSIFELQRAVGSRDAGRALEIGEHMLDGGETLTFILVMLTSYFVSLLKVQELKRKGASDREIAAEIRVTNFFVREYVDAAGAYTRREIENTFCRLARADERIKTSGEDHRQILSSTIVGLIGSSVPVA